MSYNQDRSHDQWDFDLKYKNGTVAAVEVTSSHNQELTRFHSRVFDKKKNGSKIAVDRCKYSWVIIPALSANIRRVRKDSDRYLAALESEGILGFTASDPARAQSSANLMMIRDDLHLIYGKAIESSGATEIRMQMPASGGNVGQSTATMAATNEFEPNRRKLGTSCHQERHLFVNVDLFNGGPWIAITDLSPPDEVPTLPTEITLVWLCAQMSNDLFVVWFANLNQPWKRINIQGLPIKEFKKK